MAKQHTKEFQQEAVRIAQSSGFVFNDGAVFLEVIAGFL